MEDIKLHSAMPHAVTSALLILLVQQTNTTATTTNNILIYNFLSVYVTIETSRK